MKFDLNQIVNLNQLLNTFITASVNAFALLIIAHWFKSVVEARASKERGGNNSGNSKDKDANGNDKRGSS